jgi:methylated-DNA-[protein]-cysteine S-methyltransferase
MACNKNPLLFIVPCHRVVGANGKLVGFAYGTEAKRWLLELEVYSVTNADRKTTD